MAALLRDKAVVYWTEYEVADWLRGLGAGIDQHAPAFLAARVAGEQLLRLTASDLQSLGVAAAAEQLAILKAVASLRAGFDGGGSGRALELKPLVVAANQYQKEAADAIAAKDAEGARARCLRIAAIARVAIDWADRYPITGEDAGQRLHLMEQGRQLVGAVRSLVDRGAPAETPLNLMPQLVSTMAQILCLNEQGEFEADGDARGFRLVRLQKGQGEGFGCTIKKPHEASRGLLVNRILPGGVAARSGQLASGDEIVEVSGRSIIGWTAQDFAALLPSLGDCVVFKLRVPNPPGGPTAAAPTPPTASTAAPSASAAAATAPQAAAPAAAPSSTPAAAPSSTPAAAPSVTVASAEGSAAEGKPKDWKPAPLAINTSTSAAPASPKSPRSALKSPRLGAESPGEVRRVSISPMPTTIEIDRDQEGAEVSAEQREGLSSAVKSIDGRVVRHADHSQDSPESAPAPAPTPSAPSAATHAPAAEPAPAQPAIYSMPGPRPAESAGQAIYSVPQPSAAAPQAVYSQPQEAASAPQQQPAPYSEPQPKKKERIIVSHSPAAAAIGAAAHRAPAHRPAVPASTPPQAAAETAPVTTAPAQHAAAAPAVQPVTPAPAAVVQHAPAAAAAQAAVAPAASGQHSQAHVPAHQRAASTAQAAPSAQAPAHHSPQNPPATAQAAHEQSSAAAPGAEGDDKAKHEDKPYMTGTNPLPRHTTTKKRSPPQSPKLNRSLPASAMPHDVPVLCVELKDATIKGFLYKLGGSGLTPKNWRKRWFVLKDSTLYYFKTSFDSRALGIITLPSFIIQPVSDKGRKWSFRATHAGTRTYYFSAETKQDMTRWMNAMSLAAIQFDPNETAEEAKARLAKYRPPQIVDYDSASDEEAPPKEGHNVTFNHDDKSVPTSPTPSRAAGEAKTPETARSSKEGKEGEKEGLFSWARGPSVRKTDGKDKHAKEKEKEKGAKEKETKEREAKEREAKEKEAKEKDAREKDAREMEAKEKEATSEDVDADADSDALDSDSDDEFRLSRDDSKRQHRELEKLQREIEWSQKQAAKELERQASLKEPGSPSLSRQVSVKEPHRAASVKAQGKDATMHRQPSMIDKRLEHLRTVHMTRSESTDSLSLDDPGVSDTRKAELQSKIEDLRATLRDKTTALARLDAILKAPTITRDMLIDNDIENKKKADFKFLMDW